MIYMEMYGNGGWIAMGAHWLAETTHCIQVLGCPTSFVVVVGTLWRIYEHAQLARG